MMSWSPAATCLTGPGKRPGNWRRWIARPTGKPGYCSTRRCVPKCWQRWAKGKGNALQRCIEARLLLQEPPLPSLLEIHRLGTGQQQYTILRPQMGDLVSVAAVQPRSLRAAQHKPGTDLRQLIAGGMEVMGHGHRAGWGEVVAQQKDARRKDIAQCGQRAIIQRSLGIVPHPQQGLGSRIFLRLARHQRNAMHEAKIIVLEPVADAD